MPTRLSLLIPAVLVIGASLAGVFVLGPSLLSGGASARPTVPAAPTTRSDAADETPDPRAQVEANIAILDARYAAEPINPAWATRHEAHVRDFFATHRLAAQGLAGPASLETSCHSETCRVSVRFLDPLAAELATQHLAMHVAPRLPYAAVLPRALGDGSIQVEAWYSSNRATL
jgi:hypothetical protein